MARRWTFYLPVIIGAAVACAVALSALSEKAEATFPGKNGRIAYSAHDGNDKEIYTINVSGGDKTQITHNNNDEFTPDYSPDGKKIVYAGLEGLERNKAESDIYKIKVGGGAKTKLTNNNADEFQPSWGSRN